MSVGADAPGAAHVIETHVSMLFLTDERVYKLLKPVDLGFLDHRDRAVRLHAAERELELNRRMAPDVYLGLGDLHENGELVDHLIIMRRLPADRRLSALVGQPGFEDAVRAVARRVAVYHAAQPPAEDPSPATCDAVARNWEDNLLTLDGFRDKVIDGSEIDRVASLARSFLAGREALFDRRIADGFVRDGHGDLLADDIFCLADGPRILDCLAFRDDLRIADVLCDIGFLAMDLHRLAGPGVAQTLMAAYQEYSYEHHPGSLAHHYVAYRAHVRAKVACLRHGQGDPGAASLARQYHDLCAHHLVRGELHVVMVGGGAGVGKSTLAVGLGERLGWSVIHSDEVRKDIAQIGHDVHAFAAPGEGIYSAEMTESVYREMIRQAQALLERGESVVLDATWTTDAHRELVRALAAQQSVRLHELECQVAPAIARERIARRLANPWNPSDATPDIADHLLARRDRWPQAQLIDTSVAPDALAAFVADQLVSSDDQRSI